LWQGFVSRAADNVFLVGDGGVDYFSIAAAQMSAGKGARFAGTGLWGVNDAEDRRAAGARRATSSMKDTTPRATPSTKSKSRSLSSA
jgi:hypothetical protein